MYGYPPNYQPTGFQQPYQNSIPQQNVPNMNMNPNMYRPPVVKGRIVSSLEEVKASQVDFDGSITYFPCVAENCIYTKGIDLNGLPIIQKYVLEQPAPPPQYVTMEMLEQRLSELKGAMNYEPTDESYGNPINAKSVKQPNGTNAVNARK